MIAAVKANRRIPCASLHAARNSGALAQAIGRLALVPGLVLLL